MEVTLLTFVEVKLDGLVWLWFGKREWCFRLSWIDAKELVFHKQLLNTVVLQHGRVVFQGHMIHGHSNSVTLQHKYSKIPHYRHPDLQTTPSFRRILLITE